MTPESKTERVHAAVTPSEKAAIEMVAKVEKLAVSELLRPAVEEIAARGEKYLSRLREMEPAA
jgi:hypothetical protein